MSYMAENGYTRIDAARETEDQWVQRCTDVINATLFPKARSWYMGANIPGKPSMGLVDFGGIWNYRKYCTDLLPDGFPGFTLSNGTQQGRQAEMHAGAATA
jgi:cyclohexanone monooxygenase